MNYGLYYKFDVKSGEITAIEQNPMTKNSVAVSFLTIETSLAEGQFLEVTFGKFDNNAYTVLTPALGFISINADPETYQTAIPDLIFKESGKYAFSLSVKTPLVQSDGTTDYAVLTSVQAGFTVDNTIAVISHNPLTPTEVDTINAELAALSKRVLIVESKVTNTVVVDFSVNEETGVATIIYNNGTTKTVQLPLETIDAVYQTGLVTVLNFTADSWEGDINSGYILAFGAAQTGQSDKNFIVQLCAEGTESYKTGLETTASAKQGDYTRADTVFKGSDGSLLLYSNTRYGGSLVVIGGELKAAIVQETGNSETQVMSQDATTKELNKKLNLIEPTGVQTEFVVIGKDFGGNVQQISLRGVFTPQTQYETFLPVLRGLQGQIRGQTAPLAQQNDLDLINRGELINKLSNYEKSPNYVLIEKVITGYTVLETAPEDFTTNYASYYKTNGKARNDIDFNYVALTEAETFETGKYYSKTTGTTNLYRFGESGKELDGTPYAFKNIFINFENSNTTLGVWDPIHFYVGNRPTDAIYYGGLGLGVQTNKSQVNADMQGNAVNIYAMALSAENNATKLQFRKREIISGTSAVLDGIKIHSLPADTTVLIYGARI